MKFLIRLITGLGVLGGLAFAALAGFMIYMWTTYGETNLNRQGDANQMRDITLRGRSSIVDRVSGRGPPREWVLRIPSAYLGAATGSMQSEEFTLRINLGVNPETMEIIPNPRSFIGRDGWVDLLIDIYVGTGVSTTSSLYNVGDFCIDQQEYAERFSTLGPRPPSASLNPVRFCTNENCRYEIFENGWRYTAAVPKSEYMKKDKYCPFIRGLMKNWTVKIDDRRK